jgi:hypothetical protein
MWVRAAATVPFTAGALLEALRRMSPGTLAGIAQIASADGCQLRAQLGQPVRRDGITTLHLRWWNDHERSLTPGIDGELELRPADAHTTELAITAQYRCRAQLRELADSMFLRRTAQSVLNAFLHQLVERLDPATYAPAAIGAAS